MDKYTYTHTVIICTFKLYKHAWYNILQWNADIDSTNSIYIVSTINHDYSMFQNDFNVFIFNSSPIYRPTSKLWFRKLDYNQWSRSTMESGIRRPKSVISKINCYNNTWILCSTPWPCSIRHLNIFFFYMTLNILSEL